MLSTAYLGLAIFITFFELSRQKDTKFDFLSLFHLFFVLLYALPGYFITNLDNYSDSPLASNVYTINITDISSNLQVPIAIFLTYFLVVLGFYSSSAKSQGSKVILVSRSDAIIRRITLAIFFLGITSVYIYSTQYGGLIQSIVQANLIRSEAVEGQPLAFFIRFVYFNFFASYLLASWLFIKREQSRKKVFWFLFIFAITASLISSFLVSARATMVLAFGNFYLAYLIYRKKLALPIVIPLLVIIVVFLVYGKILFYSLSGASEGGYIEVINRFQEATTESNTDSNFLASLVNVFSYGFISLYASFEYSYDARLLSDWWYGIVSFVPDLIFSVDNPPNVSEENSLLLLGHSNYTIPAGFIAGCVYSWSWIGIILFSFTYGWLGRYLQTILQRHLDRIFWLPFVYVTIAQAWSDFFASGDPQIFLQTNFWILVSLGILLIFGIKISFRKIYT